MFRKRSVLLIALIMVALLAAAILSACAGDEGSRGPAGPAGPAGPTGPAGSSPSADDIKTAVQDVLAPGASADSIAAGGRLYDKWWNEDAEATAPTADNLLWGLQTTNTRSGSTTWRCKECHGWDYKGAGGAYSSGSHSTGFLGVYRAAATMSKDDLIAVLEGGTDYRHDFSAILSQQSMENLADFLKYGLINDTQYIDYATKTPLSADTANGQTLYQQACVACHGADGRQLLWGGDGDEGIGNVADANPWEFIHKVRFGQPGTGMPSADVSGWSIQDAVDVLGHAQTLPTE